MADYYIKKPIPVEAYQWQGSINFNPAEGFNPVFKQFEDGLKLETAEGWMVPRVGSFIVKGPAGEYWAVREDIWKNTYEKVEVQNS